ncbi:2-dehydro-3-deoxy-6-phosphogalactonate aldolase [Buttiauxella sp. A2-C1_F]|uniref:2-dehydro-3-deoxy-6-phosphogalactonate aldolase n=1 Tax=unclassified Buttiauxella TaxID=2634062 RepID=UPI001E401D06|nr:MULTISPECIES: 2-dehydro-3-deoxy-6-phosphogalactonate aldolase [unclassified Buttiauxella]MCE0801034.1 2-dehydro-3-deoxy-6-phosphogalactonate aldolase [Buttiauxella sp. W03-F01]MCE0811888.1 2-dehydro-3-deoxy-6-phosphogalactonate aldolase [Buttiauxella sp. S04-F03]MCE0845585.1 2-dehydro-3-deoxy-6-phosphogalactonate aldolase [Buttiauxella sp. A2-C1_F]
MSPEQFIARWQQEPLPLIAILRGITPEQAVEAAEILLECGFHYLEVPLNSPSALKSIHLMRDTVGNRGYVGAGTVLNVEQVDSVAECGGQLIISPNCNPDVIRHSVKRGLISLPGVMTPSEAFSAIDAGASALKLFPAEHITPVITKAFRAVVPREVACLPVGGIQADAAQMRSYIQAGADGFGLGGGLYQAGMSMAVLRERAQAYQQAWLEQ